MSHHWHEIGSWGGQCAFIMKKRVLIVDDDAAVRNSLERVLKEVGYEVTVAAGGLEAAVRFEPELFDILLLDLNLPNQNGWEVWEHFKIRCPCIPVVVITGLPNQNRTAVSAGVHALLEKPVQVPELLGTMDALLVPDQSRRRK